MRVIDLHQAFIFYIYMTVGSLVDGAKDTAQIKNKRSPLEHGHVEFGLPFLKATHTVVPAIIDHVKTDLKTVKKVVPIKESQHAAHFRDEWIPGHVHDHSFIPGHFQHILLPAPTIYLDDSVVVSHDYDLPYRHHYGGFGVGLDAGGHGSGHGFHIWHAYSI